MRRVVVCTNLSLDGVMQSPARSDEDSRNGFQHGGWGAPYGGMMHAGHVFADTDSLLLGRRTYEDFYNVWPKRSDNPFTPWLNDVQKYVVSRSLKEPLPWMNSSLLGEAVAGIRALKQQSGKDDDAERSSDRNVSSGSRGLAFQIAIISDRSSPCQ